jgi:PTS system ascorbate-specific IIA component
MIGVLVLTHGASGEQMLATARQIVGKTAIRSAAIGVEPDADPNVVLEKARALASQLDDGAGVLVLTDMYGATPGNVAGALLADGRVEGVAGLSLPMLVRVLSGRNGSLADAVQRALSGGAEGVLHMNEDCCRDAKR